MSAISLIVNVDTLGGERTSVYAADSVRSEHATGWISFEGLSLYGHAPVSFRHLAGLCEQAAVAIEAAASAGDRPRAAALVEK